MTDLKTKTYSQKHTIINGVCMVLAILGVALIANQLLDRHGIADEVALSPSERKEKARRNQAEYDRPTTSTTNVGWFSSAKYDCENDAVVAQVQELIACQGLLQCSVLGLNFAKARTMSKADITAKFAALIEPEIAAAAKRVTVQPNLPMIRRGITKLFDYERDVVLAFPTLFQNVTTISDDYNNSISRYACHMNFQYDQNVIMPFWQVSLTAAFSKDSIQASIADDMDRKNPGSDYIGMLVNTTIQSQGLLEKGKEPVTAFFTVQPSGDGFVVEIKNMTKVLPGTQ